MNSEVQILRFTTAGSVDDGKSTLIGRLLLDSKSLYKDQLQSIEETSKKRGFDYIDLSLFTDGLKSEREQGITIDVAYRYFSTPKRKFIIADTPGHTQYTRNMITGASTANLAVILIDARKGILEQTKRHSFIASLLKIPHVIVCVNKMDLVDYSEDIYNSVVEDYQKFSSKLDVQDVRFIPISALEGDNVVNTSNKMPWYSGGSLMYNLENIYISSDVNHIDARLPIQYVIRPQKHEYRDYRGYSGRIEGGAFRKGDEITVLPSGFTSFVKTVELNGENIEEAYSPMSVTVTLKDDLDISRGDMIVKKNNIPIISQDLDLMICWMSDVNLLNKKKVIIKHTTNECIGIITELVYKLDINTLHSVKDIVEFKLNDIGRISIRASKSLFFDSYKKNRQTGSVILIDPITNATIAAGMIL
ncbi:MAG: Bifunctional enzyme CysN/CysC [Flavobacteriaceae bacterium]|nr:MAG: Bifunctional enzyme CysN/CysC [Flavobacteriaceae bacterium]